MPVAVPVLAACLQRWLPHTVPSEGATPGHANGKRDGATQEDGHTHLQRESTPASASASSDASSPSPSALPQLDGARLLDPAVLAELTGGDDAIASEVLRDFLDTTAQDLHELAHARDHVDAAALTRQAHKIKGAARLVGAGELAQAAADLEAAGPQGDWSALLPLATGVRGRPRAVSSARIAPASA